ncbi:MAG: dihydropteroate synthase [archaeon]|nr:dihydropteroate synthase [archaeon]
MGILNVTPDSFSDGGKYYKKGALEHAFDMIDQGADIIDVGGASTRPGSDPVSTEEELSRTIPILKDLIPSINTPVSIDTMNTEVARAALNIGINMINDVNALKSDGMMELVASYNVPCVIMHMKGMPKTMQNSPMTSIHEIINFLRKRKETACTAGIKNIILDPGIGFGKTPKLNMEIIDNIHCISTKDPILVGISRKKFLSQFYPDVDIDDATAQVSMKAINNGASIVRVHNVKRMIEEIRRQADLSPRALNTPYSEHCFSVPNNLSERD